MPIKVKCSDCGKRLAAPSKAAGKALKCPGCGSKIKVPNVQRKVEKKPDEEGAPDSEAFISTVNLEAIEHDDFQICPKCNAQILQEEEECPKCGFEVALGTVHANRTRGIVKPTEVGPFYKEALPDGFSFAWENHKLVLKTAWTVFVCGLIGGLTIGMIFWCARIPPKTFWGFLATISLIMGVGWIWFVHISILLHTTKSKKMLLPKRIRFDFAQCAADGAKGIAWFIVYSLPFTILFGGPALYLYLSGTGMFWVLPVAGVVVFLCTTVTMPQVMSHMGMPIQYRGWLMPEIAKTFKMSLLPGLYWWVLMVFTNLAWAGIMAGFFFLVREDMTEVGEALVKRSEIQAAILDSYSLITSGSDNPLAEEDPPLINWIPVIILSVGWLLASYFLAFAAIFNARTNGLYTRTLKKDLNLLAHGAEKKYFSKIKKGDGPNPFSLRRSLEVPFPFRALASIVDHLIIGAIYAVVAGFVVYFVVTGMSDRGSSFLEIASEASWIPILLGVLYFITYTIYFTVAHSGDDQASIGKKVLRVFVGDMKGKRLEGGRAFGRAAAKFFTLFFGWIFVLARSDNRALHDIMAGTLVRQQRAPRPRPKEEDEDKDATEG